MNHIELTGIAAYATVFLWIIITAIGVSGLLLLAYWLIDYTLRKTLSMFGVLSLFAMFMFEQHVKRKKKKEEPTNGTYYYKTTFLNKDGDEVKIKGDGNDGKDDR